MNELDVLLWILLKIISTLRGTKEQKKISEMKFQCPVFFLNFYIFKYLILIYVRSSIHTGSIVAGVQVQKAMRKM